MDEPQPAHWDTVYRTKSADSVSWYQPSPDASLTAIAHTGVDPSAAIIDIGGGASLLVDRLLGQGFTDVSVLDTAAPALEIVRQRIGAAAANVDFIVADITHWIPQRRYAVWHDRAVFHFLTSDDDRAAYRRALDAGLAPGGFLILATFAADGPEKCSGLPVRRHDPAALAAAVGPGFESIDTWREDHQTPGGSLQPFTWGLFRKR
jgi:SAM-dependent methyltransferase